MELHKYILPSGKEMWYGTINRCKLCDITFFSSEISRDDLLEEMLNYCKKPILSPFYYNFEEQRAN